MVKFFVPDAGEYAVDPNASIAELSQLYRQARKRAGIEEPKPEFGLGEILGRSLERGYEQTKIGLGDLLPAFGASLVGAEDYAKRQMQEAAASQQALEERIPSLYKSYEDVKTFGDVPKYAVETLGESAFDVLTSLVPGGAGAVAGRIGAQQAARQALAGAARQGLGREAAVKAAQEAAEKSATRGLLTGTYLGSYAQTAPEVFQNIYQETGEFNPTVAALYGGLSAALDSIVPAKVMNQLGTVGKGALIREMVKESGADPKVWQTIGKGVAKGFATEGLTETAQEFINNLAVKTLKENYDLFSPENVTRYIDSFLRGAIVGGGISLPSSTIEAVRERGLVKARQQEEAAKVAESERVQAEQIAAQQKLDQENQILSQIPQGIEPIKVGEDIFTVEKTGAAGDLIPRGYIVSGVQDRQVDTLDEAESLKAAMESTREDDIKAQEEERTKLIEKLAKLDEQLDQKQKDVINVSKEDFENFRDKTYPEQSGKLNEQIAIKDQILDRLNKPIEIKPLEEQIPREADEYTTFKHTPEGQQAISRHVSPEEAKERLFKPSDVQDLNKPEQPVEQTAEPVEPVAEPELVGKGEVTGQPLEELRQELDRLGLPEVGVKLYDALLGQGTPVDGAFAQQTINIAMTPATRTRLQTLHHEAIHALKEAGLFTAGEWKALSTAAKKDWLKRKWPDLQGKTVADLYADQSPEIQIEEAIAVAFEHYMKKAFSPAGQVASAFQKIANFFGRIKNFFTGKGYQTADDVFDFVASGAMRYKIRPSEVSIGPTKLAKAPPVDTEEFKQWFGDSKVVDKDGKPLVMYTGTSKDKDFSFFKIPGNGAWFSSSPEDASMYAKENDSMGFKYDPDKRTYVPINTASRVLPVYLSIQNPAKLSKEDDEAMRYASNYKKVQTNIFSRLLSEGYDGVDMGGGTWVVLKSPDQIKSAIGNVGAYGQREVTKQEAEQVGLTPAQAKAAQKKGDIRFARAAVAGAEEFKNRMLAKFYYADDQAANAVAEYFVNMPIDTLDQGMQRLGDIISYPDSKTLVRKVRLLQTYRATKQEDKADNMLKDIQEMIFNYGAPFSLKGRYKDLHIAANLFNIFVKDNKPKTDQDLDLTRQTKALYNTALDVAHALSDSKESLPSSSTQDIEEEPLNFLLPSEQQLDEMGKFYEAEAARFYKEKEKAAKPVSVKLGKKEPAFKKPQTILEERLAKYFPDIPEEHRKVFSDTLGDLKIELHNGKVVTNNQLMEEKNIYGIGFSKLIDQYKDAYQDVDSTEMENAATEAASQMYSYGNVDFKGSQDNIIAKSIAFSNTLSPNSISVEQKRIDDFYHMAREFMVELRTAYISLSNKAPSTPTEVNQPSKADFVDKVWSERNWREPWIIKTAQEMAEAFEQQRKEFKHLSVGTPEFNEFMRRTKEKRLMYHATTIRGNVGEGKAWTIFESWRNFICVTTSPWFAKDWRNADTPGAYTYRLVVMTEKPVEFWNEQQVDEILANMPDSAFSSKPRSEFKANVMNGEWVYIESENFVKSAQKLGYDAIYITERNALNMAVFSPTQVKSVIGEAGTYGIRPLTKDEAAKYGLTQAEALKQQKLGNVLFARSPLTDTSQFKNWFKDSKAVEKGEPKLMYHGTSRDITYFMPKQANAIFVTDSPKFAGAFASDSYQWMARHVDEWATPEMKKTAERYAEKLIRNDYQGRTRAEILGQLKRREGEGLDYLTRAYQDMVPIGPNIIPVYVSVQNPFDFDNKDHREKISAALAKLNNVVEGSGIHMRDMRLLANGSWIFIEEANTQKAIRDAGFDGFYVKEGGEKNLAVFDPSQLKSVFNTGAFSPDDRRISFARSPIADMQEAALEKIDAVQSKAQDNGYNLAKSPATAKQGMNVVNQFMNQSPTFGKKVVDRILDMSVNNRSMVYNFLTLEQLADVGKDILPGLTPYYETFQEMAGYRDKQLYYASKIAKRLSDLSRKEPEQTERLADVAHMATIAAFDPDRPGTDKNPEITKLWNGLNGEAKQLYRDMRDFYDNRYKAYRALLQQRIDSAITDKNRKAEVNAKIKQLFETQKVKGPYFPLSRFGQYWVSYNDGVDRFVMFEKRAEAERFAADLNGKGYKDVKSGVKEEYNLNMPVPNSVIKELIDTVDKAGNPQELKRDLWTAYLTMLPEVSMRKHFIPRKGTPGYSNDIQRVFAENTFHGAYNLARLKFAPQFEKAISDMRTTISDANKQGKGNEPGELFNALMKRQNFIMNPTPSNMITEAAGILGFTWFLTAPASAITNLSQNATVAYPVLGARFGFNKAMSEMLGASKLFMSSGERNIDEPFSIIRALEQRVKESSGAEKKAFERELQAMEALMDNGTLTRTQAMDLAAMSDKPSITQNKLNTTLKWVGAMFHGAEVFNRSTTAYAAYRMAFEKTGDQEAAIKEASRLVRRSHFDYSAANKPPILQNDFAKVIFMFKQYGINMTYLLLRESQILLKHVAAKYKGTPLEKEAIERAREARDTLIGTLGVTGLFSGVFGLPYPLYLMTMVMANALFGDEEDEIFDAETRFKLWLTDSLGADAADIIAKGPISYLSGADFSERVSANGLIFKDIGRLGPRQAEEVEQKEATMQWLVDVMGPLGGLAMNFSKGLGAMNSGNVYQGIEQMVPLPIANGMKAMRYASEGVLTMKGDPIVEEINSYQAFLRAIGYAPTEIARQLEENTSIRAVESQATLSRKQLLNRFALAIHTGDMDALEDIEAAIERFNDKYEGYEITGETLSQSIKARDAARAEMEHGLRINKRIRDVYERGSRLND